MSFSAARPLLALLTCAIASLSAQSSSTHTPARGHLVLDGGGRFHPAVESAFVAFAGGPQSHIVVIPTAGGPDTLLPEQAAHIQRRVKETFGVSTVSVLHTRDRAVADADSFVAPLRWASGVWILGGFPERLAAAYIGTKTERAIRELFDRGGVVGGTSAGAMILASSMVDAGAGLGLLERAVIFPHFDKRGDKEAVREMAAHPELLGIGIDEGTALLVNADHAEALGEGTVTLYDAKGSGARNPVTLRSGEKYLLAAHRKQ